jgi:hypothetical protein
MQEARSVSVVVAAGAIGACSAVLGVGEVMYADSDAARADAGADAYGDSDAAIDAKSEAQVVCDGAVVDFSCGAAQDSGLVAYWSFDDADGGTLVDCVGHFDGFLSSTDGGPLPQLDLGHRGNALTFDGVSQYVDMGVQSALLSDEFTISAWVSSSSTTGRRSTIAANELAWVFGLTENAVGIFTGTGTGLHVLVDGTVRPLAWLHVAAAFRADKDQSVFVGADQRGTLSLDGGALSPGMKLSVGAQLTGGVFDDFFRGSIDELRIFRRALSPCEIEALSKL